MEKFFNVNCTNITADQFKTRNISRIVSGMICTVITSIVLLALILNKAYKNTLQRLFIYLTTMVLTQLILISANIELQFDFKQREEICQFLAFFTMWAAASAYLLAVIITFYIVYIMYKKMTGDGTRSLAQSCHPKRVLMDTITLTISIGFPLCYLWVPFVNGSYGSTPVSCLIIHERLTDCHFFGFQDQIGLSFAAFILPSLIVVTVCTGVAILFCTYAIKYKVTRHHHHRTICQTLILLAFMTVWALAELFGLVHSIYNALSRTKIPIELLIITYDITIPFSQIIVPLGFIFYTKSFRKYPICCRLKQASPKPIRLPLLDSSCMMGQAPPSTRVEPPSETFFEAPYTGDFTSITLSLTQEKPPKEHRSGAVSILNNHHL